MRTKYITLETIMEFILPLIVIAGFGYFIFRQVKKSKAKKVTGGKPSVPEQPIEDVKKIK